MRIAFLGTADESNTSNRIARAINRVGGDMTARCIVARQSKCRYDEDIVIEHGGRDEAWHVVRAADWIIQVGDCNYGKFFAMVREFMGVRATAPSTLAWELERKRKRWGTRHAGSLFRDDPARFRRLDDKAGFHAKFVPCDLMRLVTDDPSYRPFLQPQGDSIADEPPPFDGNLRVCHTPSNTAKKWTHVVEEALWDAPYEFTLITGVDYATCRDMRSSHHVVIDHMNPTHGSVGAAVMEAVAAGMVVLSNDRHVHGDMLPFPRPPVVTVQSAQEIRDALKQLEDSEYLVAKQWESLRWAQTYLSDEYTYEYWRGALV